MNRTYPPRSSTSHNGIREILRPVFGIDLDGTLGDFHSHFFNFAEGWLGKKIERRYRGDVPMTKHIGISKERYRKVKLAYRRGGLKRSMPVYPGACELTCSLRERGAIVIICTTRPYLQIDNVEPDTIEWLRRNQIQYDGIIYGERKFKDLKKSWNGQIVAAVDDLPEMILQAYDCGFPGIMIVRNHNIQFHTKWRENSLYEVSKLLHELLDEWEKENEANISTKR